MMGVGQLRWQCYSRQCYCDGNVSVVLVVGGKKEKYAKPRTEWREVSYRKIGLTTVAVTHDLLSMMMLILKIELIRLRNSIYYLNEDNPVPNCPISYSSLHARRLCRGQFISFGYSDLFRHRQGQTLAEL